MARVYTFRCPHCGHADTNVWTRDGTRWYFWPHSQPERIWNGSAWVTQECLASNAHVPLLIAKHMRRVFAEADRKLQRWYHGRSGDRHLAVDVLNRRG